MAGREYPCIYDAYERSLDAAYNTLSDFGPALLFAEQSLSFVFNITSPAREGDGYPFWSPTRQVIRELSNDYLDYLRAGVHHDTSAPSAEYNNSLLLEMHRKGPILSVKFDVTFTSVNTTIIDDGRQIRCYSIINDISCLRVGVGWNVSGPISTFSIGNFSSPETNMTTEIYKSSRPIIFPSNLTSAYYPSCFPNGTLPSTQICDFDAIFSHPSPRHNFGQYEHNLILESRVPNGPAPELRYVIMIVPQADFANYFVDISQTSVLPGLVQISQLPENPPSISLDPAWILAALTISNGTEIPLTRSSAKSLHDSLTELQTVRLNSPQTSFRDDADNLHIYNHWIGANMLLVCQASSLVSYDYTLFPAGLSWADVESQDTQSQPVLWSNFRRQVYAYGLGSRTSKLGVVVVVLGVIVVLARTALKLWTGIEERAPVELVVNALKHQPSGDFEGVERGVGKLSRERWRIFKGEGKEIIFKRR